MQIDNALIIREKSRRSFKKFPVQQITFEARVDINKLPQSSLDDVVNLVKRLFDNLLERTTENLNGQDQIRFVFLCDRLDRPISTGLVRVDEITVERLLSTILKVLQSNEEIFLDESFRIDVITVRNPVGGGRCNKFLNVKIDALKKRSVLSVEIDDDYNVCCAKAIVLGKAHIEKDDDFKTLKRKDCNLLLRKALALHAAAGVPEGICGFDEIRVFEDHLDLQIVVISTVNMLKVCLFIYFSGWDNTFLLMFFVIKIYICF